jgi:predicted Zn-dependent protease
VRNSLAMVGLAETLTGTRQFRAAEAACDRLIALLPDRPSLKIDRAYITFLKTGDDTAMHSAIAALPSSLRDETGALSVQLSLALADRDWQQTKELIEKMIGGEDNGDFAYGSRPVPVGCYSIFLARTQGEQTEQNPSLAEAREQLSQKVQKLPGDAELLSQLAVVDALLGKKQDAITEIKRATEMLPISRDALRGPRIVKNVAVV